MLHCLQNRWECQWSNSAKILIKVHPRTPLVHFVPITTDRIWFIRLHSPCAQAGTWMWNLDFARHSYIFPLEFSSLCDTVLQSTLSASSQKGFISCFLSISNFHIQACLWTKYICTVCACASYVNILWMQYRAFVLALVNIQSFIWFK